MDTFGGIYLQDGVTGTTANMMTALSLGGLVDISAGTRVALGVKAASGASNEITFLEGNLSLFS